MKRAVLGAVALLLSAGAVSAAETWIVPFGKVVYEDEIDGVAMFAYPAGDTGFGYFYIPALGAQTEGFGSYLGYWIAPGDGGCSAEMTGPDGTKSKNWGQLLITFHERTYPSGWTMATGTCFGPMLNSFVGRPDLGNAVAAEETTPPAKEEPAKTN